MNVYNPKDGKSINYYFFLLVYHVTAQNMSCSQYIEKYKDEAIYQMNKYKIPASIT